MCIICQDTGTIFVNSPTFLNNPEPCPICNDFSLKELDRLIIAHKFKGSLIKSIRMSEQFYNEITNLIPLKNIEDKHPTQSLLGITITIDNKISKWEIEYEN